MPHRTPSFNELTLVIDIGKSHAKLLMVDADGTVVERHGRDNAAVLSPLGYPALDVHGLEAWMAQTLRASSNTAGCSRAIASTHGAAMVALGDDGLAWEPLDYEFDVLAQHPLLAQAFDAAVDGFAQTLSPDLPAGLNVARQLFYVQNLHPEAWRRTCCLLPYAQYWAWRLCGRSASDVSSLGCHTQLWRPQKGTFSALAQAKGWAALFAPLRSAWEVLGTVSPDIAAAWGLPAHCQVHVGVHDSNACLARYLPSGDAGGANAATLTLVSSGTWTVVMAPDAPTATLQAGRDMLGNVSVLGQPTPTARFMGGREFSILLDGAPADLGTEQDVQQLLQSQTFAMPAFVNQGGPFMAQHGHVLQQGQPCALQTLPAAQRSALAALYCAQMTAWLVVSLRPDESATETTPAAPVPVLIVEGPLAANRLYMGVLQSLLGRYSCFASIDELEGTARGAWLLSRWHAHSTRSATLMDSPFLAATQPFQLGGLSSYHAQWVVQLAGN